VIIVFSGFIGVLVGGMITIIFNWYNSYSKMIGESCKLFNDEQYNKDTPKVYDKLIQVIATSGLPVFFTRYIMYSIFELNDDKLRDCTRYYNWVIDNPNAGNESHVTELTADLTYVTEINKTSVTNHHLRKYNSVIELYPSFLHIVISIFTFKNISGITYESKTVPSRKPLPFTDD
jgi:hypothetical protein